MIEISQSANLDCPRPEPQMNLGKLLGPKSPESLRTHREKGNGLAECEAVWTRLEAK
jgi:hypothetical protein